MIRTVILSTYLVIATTLAMITLFLFGFFNPHNKACKLIFRFWSRPVLFLAGIKLDISGLENYDQNRGYIVCPNHDHIFDIPVLCIASGLNIKFAAKKELFNIPIFGQAIHLAGMVRIDRANTKDALASLKKAEDVIVNKQVSLVVYPEGTRNRSGKSMLPFKKGAFMMALNTHQAILPVSVVGADKVLQGFRVIPRTIFVHFHKTIDSTEFSMKTRKEFMTQTRDAIESKLNRE